MFLQRLPSEGRWTFFRRRVIETPILKYVTKQDYETINYGEEDWDNLIILDACRHDLMEVENPFDTEVKAVNSNAPNTVDFLKKNFAGENPDTVYVTASPQVTRFGGEFAHMEHVWQDHWDDEHKTVFPEDVTDAALRINEEYPDKKLIVHYMQPHYPFINSEIDQGSFSGEMGGVEKLSIWEQLYAGKVDKQQVKEEYRENLRIVLPEVKRLVEHLKGKTVITSDHGNLFGKKVSFLPFKVYGHPPGIKDEELTRVPWIELGFDERKKISKSDEVGDEENLEEEEIKQKLADLGYK